MTCQGGNNLCAVFSMYFFAQTQYTKQLAAQKRENAKKEKNFKQNVFEMVTHPRRNIIQVPELTGATLGPSPVGVKYQQFPEQAQLYQQKRQYSPGEGRDKQEPLINFKNAQ